MWISNQIILDKLLNKWNIDSARWQTLTFYMTVYHLLFSSVSRLEFTSHCRIYGRNFSSSFTISCHEVREVCTYLRHGRWVTKTFFFSFKGRNKAVLFSCFHLWSFGFLQFHNWLRLIKKCIELQIYTPNLHIIILGFRQ